MTGEAGALFHVSRASSNVGKWQQVAAVAASGNKVAAYPTNLVYEEVFEAVNGSSRY